MAYGYKLVENNNSYSIFEISTDQIVKSFNDKKEAKKFLRHLNLGGGFDGWSPSFFLRPVEVKITF